MPKSAAVGRFAVEQSELGSGGYGKVFRAKDSSSGEIVACKVVSTKKMRRDAVIREVRLLGMLEHDNLIGLRGTEEIDHQIFIFMELALKGDLFSRVISKGRLEEDEARAYFLDIMRGVEYLHLCGVVHRDLKLENVLICQGDVCKLCDFGLAHVFERDEQDRILQVPLHEVCGSKSYAAPEVLRGEGYDGFAADLWSCGISLFAMLAGFFPLDEAAAGDWRYSRAQMAAEQGFSVSQTIFGFYSRPCNLSPAASALIDATLSVADRSMRISSTDVLGHPWSLGKTSPDELEALLGCKGGGAALGKGAMGAQQGEAMGAAAPLGEQASMEMDHGGYGGNAPTYRALDEPPPLLKKQQAFGDAITDDPNAAAPDLGLLKLE